MSVESDNPYSLVDRLLLPWVTERNIHLISEFKDCPVRTYWVFDQKGISKVQVWLDPPNEHGSIILHAAELEDGKWSRHEVREANFSDFIVVMDELLALALSWAGAGAFS